jgi:hypothetical protein
MENKDVSRNEKENITPQKKAYIERVLYSYLKRFFLQGYRKLTEKQNRIYFYYTLAITGASIIISMLYALEIIIDEQILQFIIIFCLATSIALIIGGFIGGILKNHKFQDFFTIFLLIGAIGCGILLGIWKPINFESTWLEIIKIILFLFYVLIASISLFFIIISFITALSYRFLNWGNSPNRLLFQGALKIIVWASIPMYGYLFFQGSLDAQLLAVTGIFIAGIMLYNFYSLPKMDSAESFTEKSYLRAKMHFNQVIGFYYLYLIYHLSQSFNSQQDLSNLTVNIILLAINTIFMINNLSRKVDRIQEEEDLQRAFLFQRKTGISIRIKKWIGEKGLILMMLGLSLGYHAVYMDSYLGRNLKLIIFLSNEARDAPLNATYHRTFLGMGLLIIFITLLIFRKSESFQRIFINRYSVRHVMKMFGDLFRINEEGTTGAILKTYQGGRDIVSGGFENMKKSVKKSFDTFFSLGKQKKDPKSSNEPNKTKKDQ